MCEEIANLIEHNKPSRAWLVFGCAKRLVWQLGVLVWLDDPKFKYIRPRLVMESNGKLSEITL